MLVRQMGTQSVTAGEAPATLSTANEEADVSANVAPERIPAIFLTTQSLVWQPPTNNPPRRRPLHVVFTAEVFHQAVKVDEDFVARHTVGHAPLAIMITVIVCRLRYST